MGAAVLRLGAAQRLGGEESGAGRILRAAEDPPALPARPHRKARHAGGGDLFRRPDRALGIRRRTAAGDGLMLVYLVRHAQTASSAVDSFNGQRELPLTEQGREQARKLGERLRGVRFAAVYRSPLGRTAATAALVAPGRAAQILPGLIEIDYGGWEGLSPKEAEAQDPERYAAWVA